MIFHSCLYVYQREFALIQIGKSPANYVQLLEGISSPHEKSGRDYEELSCLIFFCHYLTYHLVVICSYYAFWRVNVVNAILNLQLRMPIHHFSGKNGDTGYAILCVPQY